MKAIELIEKLREMISKHGNLECVCWDEMNIETVEFDGESFIVD